jgi:hypothetical protein
MRMDRRSGFAGYTVIDDATGTTLHEVAWVDDVALEVATVAQPPRIDFSTLEIALDIVKVTRVAVDYAAEVIHLNDPVRPWTVVAQVSEPKPCEDCCQPETCRRIDFCAQYRCGFGEAKKP